MNIPIAFEENSEIAARFPDLHPRFDPQPALVEAERCLNCFDAPCTAACPTHIDVPRFIKKIANRNLMGSALTILEANILGASCSRVCPVEVLCEGACVLHRYNKQPIEIARLQRYAMEAFHASGRALPRKTTEERAQKIACIGSGPASLACAAELCQQGFQVTVFEQRFFPGGLNTYGVAEYKLRATESLREIELIRGLGVEFRFGVTIEDEESLTALEREYDAIFIGVGLGEARRLGIAGEDHPNVIDALRFIEGYKTGRAVQVGRRVIVIGAGNTAIDAANASLRLGAEHVTIAYRRTADHMSAFSFEYEHALSEGVRYEWRSQPIAIHSNPETGALSSVEFVRMRPQPGSAFHLPCDMVITAIGQLPLVSFLEKYRSIAVENGRILVDRRSGLTNHAKYYAGGDCVNGGLEVVDAVADGKRAGVAITQALSVQHA